MIKATSGGIAQKNIIPAGTHLARCYSMVHVGTVEWTYQGEIKNTDKVRLTFELPDELRIFNADNGEQPMVISKEYTLSLHEKSNLRKELETWRGKKFDDSETENFDVSKLIGQPCYLSIIHSTAKNNNTYANIGGISKLPKGITAPPQINPSFEFNFDDCFDTEWLKSAPVFLQDMIRQTPEYLGRINSLNEQNDRIIIEEGLDHKGNDLPF